MADYAIRGGRDGYDRLLVLAAVHRAGTLDVFDRAGVGAGMRCLDVGCGGGEVTFDLARIVGPTGSVVGLDMDEVMLALARSVATERGLSKVDFHQADVSTWTDPAAYDVVYARALLQHLPDPLDMLRRMWAAVRPGGVLIAEDTDSERAFCEPPNPGFDFVIRHYTALLAHRGTDANVGRRLFGYVRSLGAPDVHLSATLLPFSAGEEKGLLASTLDFTSAAMVSAGLASQTEITVAHESLSRHVAAPLTIVAGPAMIQVWARNPVEP
ncbi:class I SAM-dependent methyltransferase [Nocardioides mangrovi]|uniref:Class I SAM-dependent methyltransferase n=1 Tax=Nocardioides mangrovi TaxID=2874580 RepID=A0ABS7U7F7_9ACTN|nr:class I SAM-dependent methyltransferase [Nocardioides mangrovi]MBZ5736914.1 class I SAM-dependent methyltransferase [Nocardioides mangrovi]